MKKFGWIIAAMVLVAVIGGAGIFYKNYSGEIEKESLLTEDSTQAEIEENQSGDFVEDAAAATEEPSNDNEEEIAMMPDFTVYDAEGNAVKLSDFIGKPVVLNFWASWCGPCKNEMPDFEEKYKELGGEIHFLMVNMTDGGQETKERAAEFVAEAGYTFPVYYDLDMDAAITYGVTSIPSTYFIDEEGCGAAWAQGMIDAETLEKGIGMILE